jgi:competence protein ComEA
MEIFQKYLTKKNLIIVVVIISIITTLALLSHSNRAAVEVSSDGWKLKTAKNKEESIEIKSKEKEYVDSKLMVDVKGEVVNPGLYQFLEGERVANLIKKAGGFTTDAESKYVNLAAIVEDTMVIYIPKIGELVGSNTYTGGSTTIGGDIQLGSSNQNGKININTATEEELETLTGIGPSRAIAIIQKRNELGKFQKIEDLMQVTGIGDKSFAKLKDSISVK